MKSRPNSVTLSLADADAFLRSINLCFDANAVERVAHFRPTAKSIPLIGGIFGNSSERAFLIVAPYGSGKSLILTYLLHAIENQPTGQQVLATIEKRIEIVNPSLHHLLVDRRRSHKRGMVLAFHGFQKNLPQAIVNAANNAIMRLKLGREARRIKITKATTIDEAIAFLHQLKDVARSAGVDRICLLWDEAGRHLESLVAEGRSAELSDIQVLAEYVSRSFDMPMTFGVTLHQSMLHYAQQMSQFVRTEWQKISGRFETIQYVDDSKEIYQLIADIVQANRGRVDTPSKISLYALAKQAKEEHGLFSDFNLTELSELFAATYPSHPAAVFLLPRISARVAQNERTLFTFLNAVSVTEGFQVYDVYKYFSQAMRGDTAIGGTHKQWLETESAVTKTMGDIAETMVLKTACLLSMGTKGERSRVSRDMLIWAMSGYGPTSPWVKTVSSLVDRKLLLYRQHSKEVAVWHGTDVDVRGRLAEEKDRHRATFDVLGFLNAEAKPEAWKPIEYNTNYGLMRFWTAEYILPKKFHKLTTTIRSELIPPGCDGRILHLAAETAEDICGAQNAALSISDPQVIVVIPSTTLCLADASLEAWCLLKMQHDTALTGEDPLVLPEIQQMLDDARAHLQAVLDKLVKPGHDGPKWYWKGRLLSVASVSDLRRELSHITESVFPDTPRIHNELIIRDKPSGTIINSRKKLLLGMLERHGSPDLGLIPTSPEASMFRTILVHTGLYHATPESGVQYASGHTNSFPQDPGLKKVWQLLRAFFEQPSDTPKHPRALFDILIAPPFGIRHGLLPILFTAGLKAFGRAISLRHKGEYIEDVLPTVIEDLCRNPNEYEIEVIDLDADTDSYLASVRTLFLGKQRITSDTDAVRATYDAIQSWLFQLPKAALTAETISPQAKRFQHLLRSAKSTDPLVFLIRDLPEACDFDYRANGHVSQALSPLKSELEQVADTYLRKAAIAIHQALARTQSDWTSGVQRTAQQWASYFPEAITATGLPGIARSLLSRMRMGYDNEALFINSLALLVVGRSTEDWDDSTAIEFESKIQELTHRIEITALRATSIEALTDVQEIREGLSHLIAERIKELYDQLVQLRGGDDSAKIMSGILKGNCHGHDR